MDFITPDLLSTTSSPTSGGIVRTARSASFSGPAVQKSFSSVLQGVRGEEKTGNIQEAEKPRGYYKVEDRPDLKQSKDLSSAPSKTDRKSLASVLHGARGGAKKGNAQEADSPQGSYKAEDRQDLKRNKDSSSMAPQTERSEATQARTSGSEKLRDSQSQTTDSSQDESESALSQSNPGSTADGSMFVSMTSAGVSQAGAPMVGNVVPETHNGLPVSDCECSSDEGSSSTPIVTDASVRPTENRALEKGAPPVSADGPEQAKAESPSEKEAEPHVKQTTELGGTKGDHDLQQSATDSVTTHAAIQTSPSGETISSPDHTIARLVQTHEGKLLPGSQFNQNLAAPDRGDNGVAHHSAENQEPLLVPAHEDQGDAGPKTQGIIPHGQQLVAAQEELFSQSGQEHEGRQQGNPETKLGQGTVVDLPSMNGRTMEQYAAVVQSQAVSVPTAPSPTVIVPPAHPVSPVPDLTQPPTASVLRSVVLEVAQPELGHVNIRVAMMNESVHAHFLTDRVEVGQFLINGQDRLQSTLQANGLDMGQFRVDIDRQSGGRSFQQGFFHEQGQSGQQGSQGGVQEQAHGWSDEMYRPLQGRLNVVA